MSFEALLEAEGCSSRGWREVGRQRTLCPERSHLVGLAASLLEGLNQVLLQ